MGRSGWRSTEVQPDPSIWESKHKPKPSQVGFYGLKFFQPKLRLGEGLAELSKSAKQL